MKLKTTKLTIILFLPLVLLGFGMVLSVSLGAKSIPIPLVLDSLFDYRDTLEMQLVRNIRLPRALAALLTGGLLGTAGAMMQGVTRNPVAEPSLLGISQGATLAIAILYASQTVVGLTGNMVAAFVGAFFSGLFVIAFSLRDPSHLSMGKLLLAGTAFSTFFLSIASVLALLTNQSQMLGFWVSGGFRNVSWSGVNLLGVIGVFSMVFALFLASKINVINLGDDVATGFGVNAVRIRLSILLLIIPMTAATVAVGRNIAFVGLIIPQIVIRFVGSDYRKIIPLSFLLGAVLLVFSDLAARMLLSPYETPIGIFTSLIGVPFFLYLVRKERA